MIVSVMYELKDGQTFDLDYYMQHHIPLVRELLGPQVLNEATVLQGIGSPGGPAPVQFMALLDVVSLEAFGGAMQTHGSAIMGDVPNFTNAQPSIQFNNKVS